MPKIAHNEVERYGEDWLKWWCDLQPPFRGKDPMAMSRVTDSTAEWSQLLKGGPNGFFVILLALGWWYIGVKSAGGDCSDCNHAFADVQWVLEQMKLSFANPAKRARETDGEDASTSKRYSSLVHVLLRSH